jgi:hypothetical protein
MKTKIGLLLVAGAFALTAALPVTALAGPGGKMKGQALQTQTQTQQKVRDQQRLRDGSCADPAKAQSGSMQKKGNTYGPGDGTGNSSAPKDGTGYGASSQR